MLENETDTQTTPEKKSITKAEINEKPLIAWDGPIEILETVEAMESAVAELLKETHLGFDTETRPTFKKGQYYPPRARAVSYRALCVPVPHLPN